MRSRSRRDALSSNTHSKCKRRPAMKKNSSGCKSPKASMKTTKSTNVTVGMDLGDKTSRYCMLDENGEVLREASVGTTKEAITQVFATMQPCRVAIEVGTHSPWVS